MKYLEPIKSFLLFFLVGLSLTLTVMIWNYTPKHQFIEENQSEEVTISPRINIEKTLKPYRVLARTDDTYKGSISTSYSDELYKQFHASLATDLALVSNNISNAQINELMYVNNRLTLFYGTEMPIQVFTKILPFENAELPEMSFNRLIVDWNELKSNKKINIMFLNTKRKTLYRTSILRQSETRFTDTFINPLDEFSTYEEFKMANGLSLFTTIDPVESIKFEYYINNLSTDQFKEVLFEQADIVQQTNDSTFTEKYMDSMSFMTLDTQNRILNYVYPASEGLSDITPSRLLSDSFHYINDHGGFNGDYRVMNINKESHVVDYQMFYQEFPVFSSETATKITTTWGDNQIYKYRRPFYELKIPEMSAIELPSGKEMLREHLGHENIQDIVLGYYLVQNNMGVFELVPNWFFLKDDSWERIHLYKTGGIINGLE